MAKRQLFEDILHDPARFYRLPGDVLRDRRFDDGERAAILKAWRELAPAASAAIAAAQSDLEMKEGAR
jgi:hypothetical protein